MKRRSPAVPRPVRRSRRRTGREEQGAQLVEFAFLVPILLLLIFGALDFGRAYFSWIILTNGAREGARVAAVGANEAAVADRVALAVSGLPVATVEPDACPVASNQAWCMDTDNLQGDRGEAMTVRLEYNFRFVIPTLWDGTAGVFPIVAVSTMRLE